MDIHDWLNNTLPHTVGRLEKDIEQGFHVETRDSLGLSGRVEIYEVLDEILSILFPGCYCKKKIKAEDLNFFISETLRHISYHFVEHLHQVFLYRCPDQKIDCDCGARAQATMIHLIEALPEIRATLLHDIRAAKERDPAAKSLDEIVLSYPFIEAVATHRIAHDLYRQEVPIIPRIMAERAHLRTGIDIHPGATIGDGFFIDHGTGVVIGETCTIGKNVTIYQGVTLGALSPIDRDGKPRTGEKRHPDIGDNVIIYANSTILGGKTVIGNGAVIGGNTWITDSVKENSVVYKT